MNKMETIMGKWTILETVMEEYHDGPICEVGVGKYDADEKPRLFIRVHEDLMGPDGYAEYRPDFARVMEWMEAIKKHEVKNDV